MSRLQELLVCWPDVFSDSVVTKDYLDRRLNEQTGQIDKKVNALDRKIDKVEAGLKANILSLENRLTLRLGGMMVVSVAIVAALVELL